MPPSFDSTPLGSEKVSGPYMEKTWASRLLATNPIAPIDHVKAGRSHFSLSRSSAGGDQSRERVRSLLNAFELRIAKRTGISDPDL